MGRLIDASELIEIIKGNENLIELQKEELIECVNACDTAYDVDAVVEQLEERTAFLKDCTKYGNQTEEQQSKSYDTMMMYEVADLVDDLIEIVKSGGADVQKQSK